MGYAAQLPESERGEVLKEALETARQIKSVDSRAKNMIKLVDLIPESEREEIVKEAYNATRQIVGQEFDSNSNSIFTVIFGKKNNKVDLYEEILKYFSDFVKVPGKKVPIDIIIEYFRLLNFCTRSDAMKSLVNVILLFKELAGVSAIQNLTDTILKVAKWWP